MSENPEEESPAWVCPTCGGYGIEGRCNEHGCVDWACTTCGGGGVVPEVTPPWETES